jgi:hypothetical protein
MFMNDVMCRVMQCSKSCQSGLSTRSSGRASNRVSVMTGETRRNRLFPVVGGTPPPGSAVRHYIQHHPFTEHHWQSQTTYRIEKDRYGNLRIHLASTPLQLPSSSNQLVHPPRADFQQPISHSLGFCPFTQDFFFDDPILLADIVWDVYLSLGVDQDG